MRLIQTEDAILDIEEALLWSATHFGKSAARRYARLIATAISEIATDPNLAGSRAAPDLQEGMRLYHLTHSRKRAPIDGVIVKRPRHFIAYRSLDPTTIEIVRILHDSMDI